MIFSEDMPIEELAQFPTEEELEQLLRSLAAQAGAEAQMSILHRLIAHRDYLQYRSDNLQFTIDSNWEEFRVKRKKRVRHWD
jgi:hypothetical protein